MPESALQQSECLGRGNSLRPGSFTLASGQAPEWAGRLPRCSEPRHRSRPLARPVQAALLTPRLSEPAPTTTVIMRKEGLHVPRLSHHHQTGSAKCAQPSPCACRRLTPSVLAARAGGPTSTSFRTPDYRRRFPLRGRRTAVFRTRPRALDSRRMLGRGRAWAAPQRSTACAASQRALDFVKQAQGPGARFDYSSYTAMLPEAEPGHRPTTTWRRQPLVNVTTRGQPPTVFHAMGSGAGVPGQLP